MATELVAFYAINGSLYIESNKLLTKLFTYTMKFWIVAAREMIEHLCTTGTAYDLVSTLQTFLHDLCNRLLEFSGIIEVKFMRSLVYFFNQFLEHN